jgi:hypothetical protein
MPWHTSAPGIVTSQSDPHTRADAPPAGPKSPSSIRQWFRVCCSDIRAPLSGEGDLGGIQEGHIRLGALRYQSNYLLEKASVAAGNGTEIVDT